LLCRAELPIGEIAAKCGFTDVSYFSMRFRQFCGMTPREWREGSGEA
jgi:AraC-like DNA-binding protein